MKTHATSAITRRHFLKASVVAAGALGFCRTARSATPAPTNNASGFRVFGCDWTLNKTCDPAAFELAERIGLDGVQVDFGRPAQPGAMLPLLDVARQDRILAASQRHGVPVASLAFGVLNGVPYKSDPVAEKWVLDSVPVLERMNVRIALLAFFGDGDLTGDPAGIDEVIRRLKRLAPRAEAAGVVYGIESWLKVPDVERILDAVSSPAIKVYYDVGNLQKVGEDVAAAIRLLGRERICEFHLKDYDDLYGKGSMNFPSVRAAMDTIGYRGWVGIEGVKTPLGVEESIRYDLNYLRPIFPRTIS